MFNTLITFFAELDQHLLALVDQHGPLAYAIVFAVLALEVGLVFTPFLPGETLLFAAGALAALDAFNLPLLLIVFSLAAVTGNVSGYTIGRVFHARVGAERRLPRFYSKSLTIAREMYTKNPVKMLVLFRFIPFLRSLAPFVAGLAEMPLRPFLLYSAIGGGVWAVCCTLAGYAFGQVPVVRENFGLGIVGIVLVSMLPSLVSFVYRRRARPSA